MYKIKSFYIYLKKKKTSFFFYIRNQLYLSLLVIFTFFMIISLLIITNYSRIITDKIHTITESYTATINSSLTLLEENTRETAALLKNSQDIQEALSSSEYDANSIFKYNQTLRNRVVNMMHVNSTISMIYVGNERYNYHYSFDSSTVSQTPEYWSLSECLASYDNDTLFAGIWLTGDALNLSTNTSSLFFLQSIRNLNTIKPVGLIIIEVDSSFLNEAIDATAFETDTTIAFIKDHLLLYKNSDVFSDKALIQIDKNYKGPNSSSGFYRDKTSKNKYFLTKEFNPALSLSVISLISYSDLMRESTVLRMFILFLILLFFIIAFFVTYIFSNKLIKQVSLIKDIFGSNLATKQPARPQSFNNDEIGQIGKECETLLYKYNTSLKQTYELNMKQKESELLYLQEQINPHFLYNTLDSIFWMCESNGNHDAAQMSLYLSRYFRSNIGKDELTITIEEEIASINNYLAIQNIRYRNKFRFIVNIDSRLYPRKILRMLLQPLIENSLFHGLEQKDGKGTITLSAFEKGCNLIITVVDDGVGFSASNLRKGLALKNIDERIKLFYGESYGLRITSQPSIGTTVILTLAKEGKSYV